MAELPSLDTLRHDKLKLEGQLLTLISEFESKYRVETKDIVLKQMVFGDGSTKTIGINVRLML